MTAVSERDYVLGTHDEEVARLGLQHAVWRPRALDAWRRARFNAGQTLLDIGCGPGYATMDLAEIAGPYGRVIAFDRSRRFLDVLRARKIGNVDVREIDLDEEEIPARNADGAWVRWVLAFVKRPRDLVARAGAALKPGVVLVLHEYFDYAAWSFIPGVDEHEEFVKAVMKSWRDAGGEPDIARDLPRWLEDIGFEVRSIQPIVDVIRADDFAWQWATSFMRTGLQRLIDIGEISAARGEAIAGAFARVESDPRAIMITPAVLEIIAVRR